MDRDRRLSYLILKDIENNDSWSNLATGKFLSKEGADSPAFVRELVYGVLRNQLYLDYNINRFLKKPKLGVSERIWLRMGFYQLAFMSGVTEYAAINETVEIARSFKKGSEKFINAVLRSFQRAEMKLDAPPRTKLEEFLSIRYSCEKSIVKLFLNSYGEEKTEEILKASNTVPRICVRTNLLKIEREDLQKRLEALGFETKACEEVGSAFYVKGSGLLETKEYQLGLFGIQGLSSQMAASILNPKPGNFVLDLCSAPGGKTFAMHEQMKGKGEIVAFDLYEHRLKLLNSEASRLGHSGIKTVVNDSSIVMPAYYKKADCVLVDAPCSGLGTLRENPEIKLKHGVDMELPKLQLQILTNAASYVKDGGKLLYSTCTMNPLENESVIEAFLDNVKGYEVEKQIQLFTRENNEDGFFICLLRRI